MNYGQETLSLNESYANVPNDVIVKFVNYCATMIQKHVKGYQHRQRHRVIMMSIRRFKALLNSVIWGYKVRTVFKLPEVENLIDEIRYTDTGEYGDPITRNKKEKLSKTISRLLAKPLKKQKQNIQQYDQYIQAQSKNINTKNQHIQSNQYDEQPISAKRNQINSYEQPIQSRANNNPSMGNYSNTYDEQPIKAKGNNPSQSNYSNAYDEQPIKAKGNNPIQSNYSNTYDEQPIKAKGNYSTDEFPNIQEQPIKSRGNYVNPYDEQPIKGKGSNAYDEQAINSKDGYQEEEYQPDPPSKKMSMKNKKAPPAYIDPHDEIPIKAKGTYDAYDEMPIKSKGQYFDEQPIQSKGSYDDPTEEVPIKQQPKKKKVPFKKKQEVVEDEIEVKKAAPQKIEDAYENEFDQQPVPKKKKQDPKLQENLKKRTKYDPRKAIEEANRKKLEEEQQQQQSEIIEIRQPQEKTTIETSPLKTLKERIQEKVEQKSDEKNQSFEQPKKNYLKRKSKHVPIVNKKQASINSVDAEVEITDDSHLSPKAQIQKSPSKRFDNKIVDIKQVQNIQPKKEIVAQQQSAPQKSQVKRITIDELEKAYSSNYMAKYESTMQQLNELNQKRIQGATGIPILTIRSRFYATFRPSEFDHVLGVLDDQYAKLQSTLKI